MSPYRQSSPHGQKEEKVKEYVSPFIRKDRRILQQLFIGVLLLPIILIFVNYPNSIMIFLVLGIGYLVAANMKE